MEQSLPQVLDRAFRYAYALTHDEATAADCVQDACLATLKADGSWSVPYLFAAIRSRLYNRWRDDARKGHTSSLDSLEDEPATHSQYGTVNEVVALDWVENALAMLKPDERETLYLCVVEGWSAQEVADFAERPRNTILGILHRAKQKLRQQLDPPESEETVPEQQGAGSASPEQHEPEDSTPTPSTPTSGATTSNELGSATER